MKRFSVTLILLFISLLICPAGGFGAEELTIMTHDSFSVSKEVVAEFEKTNNVTLRFLKAGDAGAALNQALLTRKNPMADLFFGVDNTFMSRALSAGLFVAYDSPMLAHIPDSFKLDKKNRLLPVDFGDVCLNYDKAWFREKKLLPPASLEDLVKPEYRGLTVVENPATSSPGLAFLLATISRFGKEGYLDYWKKLRDNDLLVMNGWKEAYWGHFSAASKGDRPIVVSYASSPPAEVHYSEKPLTEAPTASVIEKGSVFRQIEFVGIIAGTKRIELARKFVDFMLDRRFQEDIPLQMFVFPVNRSARLPEVFVKYARVATELGYLAPDDIAENREAWIEAWTRTVLR